MLLNEMAYQGHKNYWEKLSCSLIINDRKQFWIICCSKPLDTIEKVKKRTLSNFLPLLFFKFI